MHDRDHYLANAERVLRHAERTRHLNAGPCSACKWSRIDVVWRHCVHPLVQLASDEQTSAYDKEAIARCEEQRDARSPFGSVVCGPPGALWEPRPSHWRRFIEWLTHD